MAARDENKIIAFPGSEPPGALRLRVDLVLMPRPVWRRLLVASTCSFWDLHVALQDVMGWEDRHLHQFTVDDPRTGERLRFGIPDESGFHGMHEILPGWQHPAAPFLRVGGHPLLYTYDFGDTWQHEIACEGLERGPVSGRLPRCLDGAGACPDEDSGGPEAQAAAGDRGLAFAPGDVVFDDPRARWRRSFGHD